MDIKVPRLGEGVNAGTVVSILVSEGMTIQKDQTVLELETEKAVAPIPATEAGVVTKILVKEGDKVSVGQAVITISSSGSTGTSSTAPVKEASKPASAPAPSAPAPVQHHATSPAQSQDYSYQSKSGFPPPASPSIRKMARDLGIDLTRVRGSEAGGRITLNDLRTYIQALQQTGAQQLQHARGSSTDPSSQGTAARVPAPSVDFSKWGPVTKKKMTNLRKTIGNKMVESWTAVPHVTQFEEANITALMALRKKYAPAYEKKNAKLTLTSFIMKVVANALKKHPVINSSIDEAAEELVYKEYVHLGIAVDTEQGLIVPVIKNVDKKDLVEISIDLQKMAEKTRARKISVDDIQGGTFNISNLGSIGGTFFTPIVAVPQVAVLGVGRGVTRPVYIPAASKTEKPKLEPAIMLPLGLSYDHRVIDGADGARFIMEVVKGLENFSEKEVKI